jgi:hypothetical protein
MPFLYLYARFHREFYPGRSGPGISSDNTRCIATDNDEILVSIFFFHLTVVLSHYCIPQLDTCQSTDVRTAFCVGIVYLPTGSGKIKHETHLLPRNLTLSTTSPHYIMRLAADISIEMSESVLPTSIQRSSSAPTAPSSPHDPHPISSPEEQALLFETTIKKAMEWVEEDARYMDEVMTEQLESKKSAVGTVNAFIAVVCTADSYFSSIC